VKRSTMLLFLATCATLSALTITACSFSASTANISDAKMARDHDQEGKHPTKVFSPDEDFYCVAELSNAPDDTKVKAVWTAVDVEGAEPDTKIDETSATGGGGQLQFSLTNDGSWPVGEYKVDLFLNDEEKPTRTLEFKVE
jgi:hypothetical protein